MPITLDKKKSLVADLEKSLAGSSSVVFVKFDRLTVQDVNTFRRDLQKENILYKVAKKTLLKRSLDTQNITGEIPELMGQVGIAFGSDLLAPAREVFAFAKNHKENVTIVGGVYDGRYMSASEMLSIATIPPLSTLRGMFVNIINSPIQRMAVVLNQIAQVRS